MTSYPFMQLYVGDYLRDTQHLTAEQHGAYLLLLMAMWSFGGSLPNDPVKLARVARVSRRRWHLVSPELLEFFTIKGDRLTQKRLDREREKVRSISEKRSASGRLGGRPKSLKTKTPPKANALQPEPEPEKKEETPLSPPQRGRAVRGTRLPSDWIPSSGEITWAKAELHLSDLEITSGTAEFADYWRGVPGVKGTKLDWPATWRNRMRAIAARSGSNGRPNTNNGSTRRRRSVMDIAMDELALAREEDRDGRNEAGVGESPIIRH